MNLGKRIELRLEELEWDRKALFELVPELTPASLSAMIRRDSKRSELDVQIAKALGVRLEWLNEGELPKLLTEMILDQQPQGVQKFTRRREEEHPAITEVIKLMLEMEEAGKWKLTERAEILAERYPLASKANKAK